MDRQALSTDTAHISPPDTAGDTWARTTRTCDTRTYDARFIESSMVLRFGHPRAVGGALSLTHHQGGQVVDECCCTVDAVVSGNDNLLPLLNNIVVRVSIASFRCVAFF